MMKTYEYIVILLVTVSFILGLKMLSSPRTARQGNMVSAGGMLLAIIITLWITKIVHPYAIIAGLGIGGLIGVIFAVKVKMTAMPQMVALLNGFGGGASTLVACAEYHIQKTAIVSGAIDTSNMSSGASHLAAGISAAMILSILIGTVTFFGSLIAFSKLQGIMRGAPITYPLQNGVNGLLLLVIVGLGAVFMFGPQSWLILLVIIALSLVLGITSVIPIGGADMPVVISLLNSYSGLAAAMTGFVINNNILIVSGALVGASGIILSQIMSVAMNRSLFNVLFGAVGSGASAVSGTEERRVVRYTSEDAATMLENAQSVIIIPGYGLAVAQAQHVLHEMAQQLMARGIKVRYAIHPVAGRMPGHMNVLLAEADVPYEMLVEMDQINEDFKNTDVAMVIGANDVVNPAARTKKDSPLYGMPILNADQAGTVMIFKRSLAAGFAGEDNDLFYDSKTMMVFGDARKSLTDLLQQLKK